MRIVKPDLPCGGKEKNRCGQAAFVRSITYPNGGFETQFKAAVLFALKLTTP